MKKIMFNDRYGLTEAVLSGRKTQTRHRCKEQYWSFSDLIHANINDIFHFERPKYDIGEVVAVAQSYKDIDLYTLINACIDKGMSKEGFADMMINSRGSANKMFVRSELMPHQIRITNVRVERLQDMFDEDCIAEGILRSGKYAMPYGITDSEAPNGVFFYYSTPREAYAALIDRISGEGTWESNPYVFVYEFELIK